MLTMNEKPKEPPKNVKFNLPQNQKVQLDLIES